MYTDIIKRVQANPDLYEPQALAEEILNLEKRKYPVEIVKIAKSMGFQVFATDNFSADESGVIGIDANLKETMGTHKNILISKQIRPGKARFVIAHELAHYLYDFDERKQLSFYSWYHHSTSGNENEVRANTFAACLLMPEHEFRHYFTILTKKDLPLFEIVERLACKFNVTEKAVQRRMMELNQHD